MSRVSSSVYPLTAMFTNCLACVLHEGGLTHYTEEGHASLVGSIHNLSCNHMSYSCLLALDDLYSGSQLWVFSLGLHVLPTCPLSIHPIRLLDIVTSFIPYASL